MAPVGRTLWRRVKADRRGRRAPGVTPPGQAPNDAGGRGVAAGAGGGAVLGVAPHLLHHAGLLAGASVLAGAGGTLLFAALGLLAAVPLLVRMRRRTGGWLAPGATLAASAALFALSALVIGPAVTGARDPGAPPAEERKAPPPAHEKHNR